MIIEIDKMTKLTLSSVNKFEKINCFI